MKEGVVGELASLREALDERETARRPIPHGDGDGAVQLTTGEG